MYAHKCCSFRRQAKSCDLNVSSTSNRLLTVLNRAQVSLCNGNAVQMTQAGNKVTTMLYDGQLRLMYWLIISNKYFFHDKRMKYFNNY